MRGQLVWLASLVMLSPVPIRDQAPPPYDVRVELDRVSTGTTTFIVDKGGKVSGKMRIDVPNVADATLTGAVKDGVWTFEFPYAMPELNCSGIFSGTAKVTADQGSISGKVTISGECAPQPISGTFAFTRRLK